MDTESNGEVPMVLDLVRRDIAEQISRLVQLGFEKLVPLIEPARKKEFGDYAIPVVRIVREFKIPDNPVQLAKRLAEKFKPSDYVSKACAAGPYVNFFANMSRVSKQVLEFVFKEREKYGQANVGKGRTVIVEFSSPNIAKPFHAGHLRSTILGNFLKNVHSLLGYHVVAMNWLGDWGVQYGLLALGFEKYGSEEALEKDPLRHLYEVYVKIHQDKKEQKDALEALQLQETDSAPLGDEKQKSTTKIEVEGQKEGAKKPAAVPEVVPEVQIRAKAYFKRMEEGDASALSLWRRFRDLSIAELNKTYSRLNIKFDIISGESEMSESEIEAACSNLAAKGLLTDSKGAQIVDLSSQQMGVALIRKADGTTLYLSRDMAAAIGRFSRWKFHRMFYVVSQQQALHFQQLFKVLQLLGHEWYDRCVHVPFGMVRGISTRKGTAVFLDDIMDEARAVSLEAMNLNKEKMSELADPLQVADIVGTSAIVVQDFLGRRIKDYDFNLKRMTSFEGFTGPYLQYAHARLCSIERKADVPVKGDANCDLLVEKEAKELIWEIARFPLVVLQSAAELEPTILTQYLFQLSHAVSAAHSVLWVKDREPALSEARMLLFWAARTCLGNGMRLLGLTPVERM